MDALAWQGSLLDDEAVGGADARALTGARRDHLAHGAWVDALPGWVRGPDALFAGLLETLPWRQRSEIIRGEVVDQPRLTAHLAVGQVPPGLAVLDDLAAALSDHYGVAFTRIGCNLYRDGRDSVAWHGDRVLRDRHAALVAIVSLGHPRTLRIRPAEGGESRGYRTGRGDLLVMGGTCQRTHQHGIAKVASAGPRISVTFRHR